MIGETIVEAMHQTGYAIDWARDAREAELSLLHDLYDLVMLDLGLPEGECAYHHSYRARRSTKSRRWPGRRRG